jgi:hypothetical protein
MKILWNNLLDDAELSSLNASLNYPVTNLQDSFLYVRTQSSIDVDTVTIMFDEDASISDFFWGYTNATKFVLRLYNYENELLYTETINDPDPQWGSVGFDIVEDVDHAELDIIGDEIGTYLGGIGIGIAYVMPDPLSEWDETPIDNSDWSRSPAGQTLQNYTRPLRREPRKFADVSHAIKEEIMALYYEVGTGAALWFDFTELDHDYKKPLYGIIANIINPQKNGRMWEFDIVAEEAR